MHINLRGGQSYALGFIHGVEHIAYQCAYGVVHRIDRAGHGMQFRVRVNKNR